MRVLQVDAGREMRGGQWQCLYLMEELGKAATLLTPAGSPLMAEARRRGLDARPLGLAELASLSRQVDLTHAHDARSHSLAAMFSGTPLVVSRRVAFPLSGSLVSRWKYRRAARFLAISHFVKDVLIDGRVPETKIDVVYDGVRLPAASASGTLIVSPASDDPLKGNALLREAAKLAGVEVVFSRNLAEDVQRAALFVYITSSEGLGSAALVAMAANVPVVASRVGGLPEIVEHEVTGLLTDNDPASIACAIREALARRFNAGRARVEERFTVQHMVAQTRHAYERLAG